VIDVSRTRSRVGALGALAAIAVLWLALAPTQLGGPTSFASIVGVSMEPHLHAGDLVVVRRSGDYRVGDVVAYRSAELHRIVLHRIAAIDGDRYRFKGDNNDFVDPGSAARSDLVGRQWLRLPGAGRWFGLLHRPWVASLLAVLAVLALLGTGKMPRRRGARGRRAAVGQIGVPPGLEPLLRPVTTIAAAASVVYLLLAAVALGLPAQRSTPVADFYEDTGAFSYGGAAPVSAAYPTGRIGSGDTVFTRLVDTIDVGFRWQLKTSRAHAAHGTASLSATVSDGSGWSRRLTLALPRSFAGDRAVVHGRLDLGELQRLVAAFESETGTNLPQYRVELAPRIAYAGTVGGLAVSHAYAPTLDLVLSEQALQLASDGVASPSLVRSEPRPGSTPTPARLGFGPFHLRVATARVVGIAGTLLSLLVLGAALVAGRRLEEQDPVERELARSGQQVVRIADERRAARLVDVRHLAGLLRIARRYDRLVLYAERSGAYLVEDDDVVYRWRRPAADGTPPPEERPAFEERRDLRTRPWAVQPEEEPFAEAGEA
jgi:signal peptidase I